MRFEHVAERLTPFPTRLPEPAGVLMAVLLDERVRRNIEPPAGVVPRAAAVLVLIHPDDDGEARVVLTERATRDGHHSGEVSFPGGRAEDSDHGPVETALREAEEEVALDAVASSVRVLGQLDRVWIPVSNFDITPIVAVAERMPALRPSEAEVARIVHARLDAFVPGAPVDVLERQIGDWPIRFGAYPIEGLAVWGATARILSQLGALVADQPSGDR